MREDMHIHLKSAIYDQNLFNEYIQKCKDVGLKKVVFLDHGNRISNKHKPVLYNHDSIDSLNAKILSYRKSKTPEKLKIIKGIEIDYSNNTNFRDETLKILQYGDFEWVVGAIHSIKFENFGEYLKAIIDMINNYPINVIAHIKMGKDYLIYKKIIIDVLKLCSEKNIFVEINTSDRSRWTEEQLYYMLDLMEKYKVKYVYSSDAHCVDEIGYMIDETLKKVKQWQNQRN